MDSLNIEIQLSAIFSEVDVRTYYQGESLKKKDADFSCIQTSSDDYDTLRTPIETALNNINGRLIKRVRDFKWSVDEAALNIELIPHNRIPPHVDKVVLLLKKAIFDYIVNYVCYEWFLMVNPELAPIPEKRSEALMWDVVKFIGMISGMIRRRATDLAGI